MSRKTLKLLYVVHKWIGLALVVLFILQAATGLMLAYKNELRDLAGGGAFHSNGACPGGSLDDVYREARTNAPEGYHVMRIIQPREAGKNYLVRLINNHDALYFMLIDSASLDVRRQGGVLSFPLEGALYFHDNLLLGSVGRVIVGVQGVLLVILVGTGLILWWPKPGLFVKSLTIRPNAPYPRLLYELHSVPAVIASVVLTVMAITGSTFALRGYLSAIIPGDSVVEHVQAGSGRAISIQRAMALSLEQVGAASLKDIRFNQADPHIIRLSLYPSGHANPRAVDQVWVDLHAGVVVSTLRARDQSGRDRVLDWALPLHTGEVLGGAGRFLFFMTGIIAMITSVTGILLWLKRRQLRSK